MEKNKENKDPKERINTPPPPQRMDPRTDQKKDKKSKSK